MLKACILFAVGLILLIFGGDWFVDAATGIAKRFHISELMIGATVVAIGTTLPEVMVSATGALAGHPQIAYGNALGSIICNAALISGITIAFNPSTVDKKSLSLPVIFFFIAAAFYCFAAYGDAYFSRTEGIMLLCIFLLYIIFQTGKASSSKEETQEYTEGRPLWQQLLLLAAGAVAIAEGANLLVDNGTVIAKVLGVPETVIALTFMALGTSLPELVTAIASIRKGHDLLSLGNIIGANLFNIVLVAGVSITLRPFAVPFDKALWGMNASFIVDIPLVMTVMLILTVPPLLKGRLYRWQGILLLLLYVAYSLFNFVI